MEKNKISYEYFVAYRWYGKWKNFAEGYGNMDITLPEKISKAGDISKLKEAIRKEYPEFETIIIVFFKEFELLNNNG